jgi:hypothetical protein
MDSISLSGFTSISQWTLFLGIGLIIFGIIEKRENYVLAGQIAFIVLGILASLILFTKSIPVPTENTINIPKEIKALSFFKGAILMMAFALISLLLKLFKLPFQKTSIYILVFFALILFFMLFNITQMTNIPAPK